MYVCMYVCILYLNMYCMYVGFWLNTHIQVILKSFFAFTNFIHMYVCIYVCTYVPMLNMSILNVYCYNQNKNNIEDTIHE